MKSEGERQTRPARAQVRRWAGANLRPGGKAPFPTFALARFPFVRWCWICVVCCSSAFAVPVKIELPAETAVFKAGQGAELANGQCLVCHSVEYVIMQPPSPRPFWAASVKKMREKYGAVIADEQVEPLLNYLTKHYGVETTNNPSATVTTNGAPKSTTAAGSSAAPLGGEAVATKYFCVLCHDVNVKKIGPPFKDIAAKYRTDPEASKKVTEQVHNGGSGKWGPVVMPPFPMVTDAETKAVAEWILSQK